jgi:glycosyltransferase involved in cell wall biosynthesis
MLVSVVVRTKDEADRLRLVLASLSRQTVRVVAPGTPEPAGESALELIVVNDGSQDHTRTVLEAASRSLPLLALHHPEALGRSAAANAGTRAASGSVLLFLDGDTLAAPEWAAVHARMHDGSRLAGRGEVYNLRCTRFFQDPETGSPQPGQEEHVHRLGPDLTRHVVTRRQVLDCFEEIHSRAEFGIYPGAGPRRLAELEMDALRHHPELSVLWMAASGSNFSVRRADFEAVGGYDERLTTNEHRELALRLSEHGVRVVAVDGARTYHLTHRVGWRDPLTETSWERIMYSRHPCLAVKLMSIFWMSIGGVKTVPDEARIQSLPEMDAVARGRTTVDYDAIRRAYPELPDLSAAP